MEHVLSIAGLDRLLAHLAADGFRVVGPTMREGTIVYGDVSSAADLPGGWGDEHEPGHYRLRARDDDALFGFAVGPHSWKQYLHPPTLEVLTIASLSGEPVLIEPDPPAPMAFIGVRACDISAIAVQDNVFMGGAFVDRHYATRREPTFVVAANCTDPGGTCFCVSMSTGPGAAGGFDIALTEVLEPAHHFIAWSGTDRGAAVLEALDTTEATAAQVDAARRRVAMAAESMGRQLDTDGLPEVIARNREHPRWDAVAERCLACANCTMVCPTCFCSTFEETTDLADNSVRVRRWDSCFNDEFSYMHGGPVRESTAGRYRQWLTHKLSSWWDQFGQSGCVGCGRCITWCPVGIDITAEAAAVRAEEVAGV